ncbi:MAG: hypothetical protein L0206_11745 [Actinobacteria bacterium]|nr:hypothetical protein [Actinomycetota bacterium]
MSRTRVLLLALSLIVLAAAAGATAAAAKRAQANPPVKVEVFAPRAGDVVGKQSRGFFVDLALEYPSLASSGADLQLTGPGAHQNQAPLPGAFAAGVDDKLPGLIVLLSTSTIGARNAQNLANLFNLTGFTNQKTNEIWDTWLVGAASFGKNVRSVLRVAVAADKNKDGIYNDAPAVVPDSNRDGRINAVDLKAFGLASEIVAVPFRISD